jgi:hypothetical protein
VYDNAGAKPVVVAEGGGGATAVIHDTQTFDQILEKGGIDRSPTPFTADTFQSYLDSQPVGTRFTLPESSATGAVHGTWEQEDLSGMRFWRAVDGRQAGEFQSSGYFGTTYQRPVLDALGPPPVDVAATLTPADAEGRVEMPDKTDRFRDEFRNIGLSPAGDHFSQQLVQTFADWPYLNPKTARELRTWLKTEQKGSGLFTLKGLKERGVDDPRGMRREVNRVLDAIDKRLPEGKQNPKYGEDHPEATSAAYITGGHANSPEQLMGEFKRLGVEENELARIDPSIIYVGRDPYYMSTNQGVWAYPYKGTAVVVETPMSKDALSYSWEQAKEYQVKINAMLDRIPETTNRDNFKSLFVGQRGSPSDERIAAENGLKDFEAAAQATSQTGQMWLWHGSTNLERQGIIDHEFGHIIGNRNGALAPDKWQLARADDMPVSNEWIGLLSGKEQEVTPGKFGVTAYGSTNDVEDWAESVRLYLQDRRDGELGLGFKWKPDQVPWPPGSHEVGLSHPHISDFLGEKVPGVRFADIFPNRAKLLDRWLFTDLPVNAPSASEALATRLKGTIKTLETQLRIAGDDAGRKLFQDLLDERRAELDALNKGEPSPAIDAYAVAVEPKPYMEAVPVGGVLDVPATPATIDTAGKWKKLDDGQWQAVGRGGEKRSSDFLDVSFAIGMTLLLPGPQLGRGLVADRAAWVVFLHQLHAYLPRHPLPPPSGQPTTSQEENKKTGPPPSLYDQTVAKLRRKAGR